MTTYYRLIKLTYYEADIFEKVYTNKNELNFNWNLHPVLQIQLQAGAEINEIRFAYDGYLDIIIKYYTKVKKLDFVNISFKSPRDWVRLIYNLKPQSRSF